VTPLALRPDPTRLSSKLNDEKADEMNRRRPRDAHAQRGRERSRAIRKRNRAESAGNVGALSPPAKRLARGVIAAQFAFHIFGEYRRLFINERGAISRAAPVRPEGEASSCMGSVSGGHRGLSSPNYRPGRPRDRPRLLAPMAHARKLAPLIIER
jgi:hypothetical protein